MTLLADSKGPDQTVDAQVDLCLHCPHMPEGMFLHGVAQSDPGFCCLLIYSTEGFC